MQKKSSIIALIGAPNAGKSTLLNQLLGEKLAIVTPKVQTTRRLLRGILTESQTQLVFVDTPGIFTPKRLLERKIVAHAWEGVESSDQLVLVVDATRGRDRAVDQVIAALKDKGKQALLVLNKIDKIRKETLLDLATSLDSEGIFPATYMISALKGHGVDRLKRDLLQSALPGGWLFEADQISDAPMRFLAAEVTREQLFFKLQQELPYSLAVETEQWEEDAKKGVAIHQVIYVQEDRHKKIILGKGGQFIKEIGSKARTVLEDWLQQKVHLFLFVKVRSNWMQDDQLV